MSVIYRSLVSKRNILLNHTLINFSKTTLCEYSEDKTEDDSTLYKTLGLNSSATSAEIKKAYYDLTMKYHPDRNEGNEFAAKKFREVTEAYEILGNYGMRKRYDKGLPLPLIKKQSARPPIVEKEVKYQKFYDRRSSQKKEAWQDTDDEDEKPHKKQLYLDERQKLLDTEYKSSRKMETFVGVFVVVMMAIKFFYID